MDPRMQLLIQKIRERGMHRSDSEGSTPYQTLRRRAPGLVNTWDDEETVNKMPPPPPDEGREQIRQIREMRRYKGLV